MWGWGGGDHSNDRKKPGFLYFLFLITAKTRCFLYLSLFQWHEKAWFSLLIIVVPTTGKSMAFFTYHWSNDREKRGSLCLLLFQWKKKALFSLLIIVQTTGKSMISFTYYCSTGKSVVFFTYHCSKDIKKRGFRYWVLFQRHKKAWFSLHILFHGAHIPLGSADLVRTGRGDAAGSRGRLNASSEFGVGLHNDNILNQWFFFFRFLTYLMSHFIIICRILLNIYNIIYGYQNTTRKRNKNKKQYCACGENNKNVHVTSEQKGRWYLSNTFWWTPLITEHGLITIHPC